MTKSKSNVKAAKSATKKAPVKGANRLAKSTTTVKTAVKKSTPTSKKVVSRSNARKPTPSVNKVVNKSVAKTLSKKTPVKKAVAKKTTNKKEVKPESQYNMVLNHLIKKGSITPIEAMTLYGVLRLGAVVFDLKKGGVNIKTSTHTFINKNGRKSSIAKYIIQ